MHLLGQKSVGPSVDRSGLVLELLLLLHTGGNDLRNFLQQFQSRGDSIHTFWIGPNAATGSPGRSRVKRVIWCGIKQCSGELPEFESCIRNSETETEVTEEKKNKEKQNHFLSARRRHSRKVPREIDFGAVTPFWSRNTHVVRTNSRHFSCLRDHLPV